MARHQGGDPGIEVTQPLNAAMLGTGRIAELRLAPAIAKSRGIRLWSVLSRDPARAADFARRHGARAPEPAHVHLDQLLADPELDAVVVATPDRLHAAQALAAVEAGKHVLVEKPMVTSTEDGRALVDARDRHRVTVAVGYHLRWHAGHRRVERLVRDGALGHLRHLRAQWTWPASDTSNWRAQPAMGRWWSLAGVGTHCLDTIRWLAVPSCGEVVSVESVTSRSVWGGPHDETAVVVMAFESGATAEFCSSVQFGSPSRLEVYGSGGYVVADRTLTIDGEGSIRTHEGELPFKPTDPYLGEVEDFVGAIRDGRPPAVDAAEGLRNVEILESIS